MQEIKPRLYTSRLARWLELVLRQDDCISLPMDEALCLQESDPKDSMCHVEFPDKDNKISQPRVWSLKAWYSSLERHEKARVQAVQDKLEFENYKSNIKLIATRLSQVMGMPTLDLMEVAQRVLHNNPESLAGMGVELIKPYYRGEYVVLPFRERDY